MMMMMMMMIMIIINKLENQNFENWELNLEIGILKNYLKMEFKINK